MGRTVADKREIVAEIKERLSESTLALVIDYQGLSVAEMKDLRRKLMPSGAICKVTKNTFMGIAIKEQEQWQPLSELLKGSNAFLLVKEDFSSAIKAYQEFQKVTKDKTTLKGGVMDGKLLKEADVKILGDLPSKEQLMAQIAGAINGVATMLATGINEVPTSLARALQAVAEKEGGATDDSATATPDESASATTDESAAATTEESAS
jgi:large subunit ribosomal protein L10